MYHKMDEEHRQLLKLLDTLNTQMSGGHSLSIIFKLFNDFMILANQHFKNEEKMMNVSKYPGATAHKQEHDELLNQLETMSSQLKRGQTPFGKNFISWQTNWIENHLKYSDKKLVAFLKTYSESIPTNKH